MPRGARPGERRGGRVKGTPNRATVEVAEKLAALDYDPIMAMAKMAKLPDTPIELKVRLAAELAQYVAPKRKAVEMSAPGGGPLLVTQISIGRKA